MKKVLIVLLSVIFLQSCYYDKEELLYPVTETPCDTSNVTYSGSVSPIASQYCLSCHSNASAATAGAGIKLEDYADIKVLADNGKLLGSVKHETGISAMPKGGGKLNNCNISLIELWVNSGAPNN